MDHKSTQPADGKSPSSVQIIIKAIKNMIIEQNLHVGDKIPNESELSAMFGKSRGSVREAVKILDAYGVLEVKRGDGTYVRGSPSNGVFDAQFFRIIAMGTNMPDLMQMRLILETGIICSAIDVITDDQFARIRKLSDELDQLISANADIDDIVAADLRFHMQIADVLQNSIMKDVYENMMDLFTSFIRFSYLQQRASNSYSVVAHHELMLQALYERDQDLGRYAIRASLKDWESLNQKYKDYNNSLHYYSSKVD